MPAAAKIRSIERRLRSVRVLEKKITWKASLPKQVLLKEVAPRDGLQSEAAHIPVLTKVQLIRSLIEAGHQYIEVTAFVSPKAIPQLADADAVARQLPKREDVTFSALVPNQKGMERAVEAGMDEVAVFTAASETFNQKNINASIEESFKRFEEVFKIAQKHGKRVRGYISTCFVCPYEGKVSPRKVVEVSQRLFAMGCYEVAISDTIGKATPKMVWKLFDRLLKKAPASAFAGHFHDTYGMALTNVLAAMGCGIRTFDSSVGGLGGCPYAPGAAGNVATEDLVFALDGMGIETGLDLDKLIQTSAHMEKFLNHAITSKVYQAEKSRLNLE